MDTILEVSNITKSYQNKIVVNQLSFTMREGEFLSFIGPNGAGKSTTISILCSLLQFDSGNVKICDYALGKDNLKIRQHIGVVFQNSVLDDILTLKNNLLLRCGLYHLTKKQAHQRVKELSLLCGLDTFIKQKVSTLSGGERRKGDIARALITKPKLLILDEPTTGLDPQSRLQIWETIEKIRKQSSMAILLTTHYMEEAEKADRIIMINHGEIIAQGSVAFLTKNFVSSTLTIYSNNLRGLRNALNKNNIPFITNEQGVEILLKTNSNPISILNKVELYVDQFEVRHGTLEDAFLKIVKEE
jgi:ABC-type multidrug transport system, ATPase component